MTRNNTSETTQNRPNCRGNQYDQHGGNQDVTHKEQYGKQQCGSIGSSSSSLPGHGHAHTQAERQSARRSEMTSAVDCKQSHDSDKSSAHGNEEKNNNLGSDNSDSFNDTNISELDDSMT